MVAALSSGAAEASRRIVENPVTGFAISGFDPVAYFADGGARPGAADYEATWQEATWRFANAGNRQAFVEAPETYAPAHGGHCVVAVARGDLAEGNPQIWTIYQGRLYFFHSQTNRQLFAMDPEGFIAAARSEWSRLIRW